MRRSLLAVLVLVLTLASSVVTAAAKSGDVPATKGWWSANLASGTFEGVQVVGGSLTLDPAALLTGTDTAGRYNGGAYYYGRFTAPEQSLAVTEAIPSWLATTQPGTWIEVELRARVDGLWSKWYSLGVWLEQETPFRRHSVGGQADKTGTVATDTLVLSKVADALQARVTLFAESAAATPAVRALGLTYSNGTDKAGVVPSAGLVSDLAVPKRSQMVFPDGGEVWCSPTSTSMVMAYWGVDLPVPTVVKGVWDYRYNGGGNWPFNTAYAGSLGLEGKVARLSSLAEVERWTAAGVPVIASIAFRKGELTGAPISSTAGHLVVIRGFDAAGNVLVNDPAAASDEGVALTYNRVEFEAAWLGNSNGVVYLIYPAGWAVPATNGHW
ncbi:MAG TPA: peptidase C39 family protein [Symbiobacteriaceae bacterium]|nr:peptidase C39 family protein [Symbiobacteriaceae bacterium]